MKDYMINWAKLHDWYIRMTEDGKGVIVRDREQELTFYNSRQLYHWAGY